MLLCLFNRTVGSRGMHSDQIRWEAVRLTSFLLRTRTTNPTTTTTWLQVSYSRINIWPLQMTISYPIKKILDHKMKYSLQSERRKRRQLNASLIHPTTFHTSLPKLRKYAQHAAAVVPPLKHQSSTSRVRPFHLLAPSSTLP